MATGRNKDWTDAGDFPSRCRGRQNLPVGLLCTMRISCPKSEGSACGGGPAPDDVVGAVFTGFLSEGLDTWRIHGFRGKWQATHIAGAAAAPRYWASCDLEALRD